MEFIRATLLPKRHLKSSMAVILRVLLVSILAFSGLQWVAPVVAAEVSANADGSLSSRPAVTTMTGPWGELEYFETAFIAPQSLIDMFVRPTAETIWRFPGWTRQQVTEALAEIPFHPGQLDWIDQPDGLFELKHEVRLYPTDEMLTGMNLPQRRKLHRLLANWRENVSHRQPKIVLDPTESKNWFRAAGLPGDVADEIANLCFFDGGVYLFTEVELIMKRLDDEALQDKFLRALTRTPALIVRLKIAQDSDLSSIADYWRGYEKRKAISPILESVTMTPGVDYIDIAHLLPPMPRMLLNTFPDPTLLRANKSPDCTWTVVHFFRSEASSRLMDFGEAVREMDAAYEPTTDDAKFGDLLSFVQGEDDQPIHAAVYIAGDIAFTKNGNGLFVPWVLMRIPDIVKLYSKDQPVHIKRLRLAQPR